MISELTLTVRGSTLLVCRRQILTSKVNPRTVKVKNVSKGRRPISMYSNESERANLHIYNDFKLKKPFGLHG